MADLSLGRGRKISIWQNSHDQVEYSTTQGHVFSLYLKGGGGTRRIDGGTQSGKPDTLCIFPEGHSSEWEITDEFQFVHLYVTDDILRASYSEVHNKDARRLDITERIFAAPERLKRPLLQMAHATVQGDLLSADTAYFELVSNLSEKPIHLNGGLSQNVLRHVNEWIDAHIEDDIRLSDLAHIANLSEFHFHRMFVKSCGTTPHKWIMHRRILRAKTLVAKEPMTHVALACGFSSQSHLIRRFKEHVGVTPGQYLRMISN
ncbi:MAG: helix-turn-helix domain-containing protein [Halocynthiibacter sp.]